MAKRVLIVDDDMDIRWAIRRLLEWRGYECEEADTGVGAMALLQKGQFDLVITDHQMPKMSGVELLECLRKVPEKRTLPVILLSGNLRSEERERALKVGVHSIWEKPFDCEELVSLVARAVEGTASS